MVNEHARDISETSPAVHEVCMRGVVPSGGGEPDVPGTSDRATYNGLSWDASAQPHWNTSALPSSLKVAATCGGRLKTLSRLTSPVGLGPVTFHLHRAAGALDGQSLSISEKAWSSPVARVAPSMEVRAVLLDYGRLGVHVFKPDFPYRLEPRVRRRGSLWARCRPRTRR